jgi:hypothetical protein
MKMRRRIGRALEVERVRLRIERTRWPRVQMSLLVMITGASGFVASYLLFRLGVVEMGSRYALMVLIAYLVFLLLLWVWLRSAAREFENLSDLSDLDGGVAPRRGSIGQETYFETSADGGTWTSSSDLETGSDLFEGGLDAVGDTEGLAIPIALIALVAGLLVSVFFVITSAPVLFAELIVDGVLSASLYRRLRGLEPAHWLQPALRRTFWPFVLTALLAGIAGWEMERHAPGAHTIAQVLHPALRDPR